MWSALELQNVLLNENRDYEQWLIGFLIASTRSYGVSSAALSGQHGETGTPEYMKRKSILTELLMGDTSEVVLRNNEGTILLSHLEIHRRVPSAFAVEALACRTAVKIAMEKTWSDVIIEGDSLTVIKKCNSRNKDRSMIGAYIMDIKQMVPRSKHFVFKHISRTANTLAHKIATESLRNMNEIYLEGAASDYAEFQRLRESVREPD
ncbi:glycine, alanine and asparagine-rich protein-like [Gossypium australe]|uniref:Glycine, alanine and asparagine-rich protein-like n=1 Tax=Gossypium australe TaxID=47621 RepID=A0A5B6VU84_9ROSI|nr:glycine, alanine and asparagine-rich protein-like [Gossypium australe]